jgi:regulator of sigma E protease
MAGIITAIWVILVFGLIIFIHELGHFGTAKFFGVKVHEFAIGMGPAIWKKQKNETLYSVRAIPMGGYVKMEGEDEASSDEGSFSSKKPWQRFIILFAGAFMNIALGFLISIIFTILTSNMIIGDVLEGYPAQTAGIQVGDRILKVNGVEINSDVVFKNLINELKIDNQVLNLEVSRNGQKLNFSVPIIQNEKGVLIGIAYQPFSKDFSTIISYSYIRCVNIIQMTYQTFFGMFSGKVAVSDVSGPVGIVKEIGAAAQRGFSDVLFIGMLISLNLGVINLMPIPALDGGRIVFVLFEMITRRKLKPEWEGYIHFAGFALLILFMLYVTKNDIVKLFVR